jgi:hypothetical protein
MQKGHTAATCRWRPALDVSCLGASGDRLTTAKGASCAGAAMGCSGDEPLFWVSTPCGLAFLARDASDAAGGETGRGESCICNGCGGGGTMESGPPG